MAKIEGTNFSIEMKQPHPGGTVSIRIERPPGTSRPMYENLQFTNEEAHELVKLMASEFGFSLERPSRYGPLLPSID